MRRRIGCEFSWDCLCVPPTHSLGDEKWIRIDGSRVDLGLEFPDQHSVSALADAGPVWCVRTSVQHFRIGVASLPVVVVGTYGGLWRFSLSQYPARVHQELPLNPRCAGIFPFHHTWHSAPGSAHCDTVTRLATYTRRDNHGSALRS